MAWIVVLLHGLARELGFGLFNAIGGVGGKHSFKNSRHFLHVQTSGFTIESEDR